MKGQIHPETMGSIASQRIFATSLSGTFSDSLGGESCGKWPGRGSGRACRGRPFPALVKADGNVGGERPGLASQHKACLHLLLPKREVFGHGHLALQRARGRCSTRRPGRRRGGPARRPARCPAPCHARPWSWREFCHPAPLAAKKNSVVWGCSPRGYYINSYISCSYLWCLGS